MEGNLKERYENLGGVGFLENVFNYSEIAKDLWELRKTFAIKYITITHRSKVNQAYMYTPFIP